MDASILNSDSPCNEYTEPGCEFESTVLEQTNSNRLDVLQVFHDLQESGKEDLYRRLIEEVDKVILLDVLRQVKGNQVHASKLLGISRTTLRTKMKLLADVHQRTDRLQFSSPERS